MRHSMSNWRQREMIERGESENGRMREVEI
jgi:hypothetical protein